MQRQPAIMLLSLALPVLLGACRVERTPDEYIDHTSSVEAERVNAEGEVRDRLLAFVGAAGRGAGAEALIALNPADDADVVAPQGVGLNGAGAIRALVAQLVTTPVAVQVREVSVRTNPTGAVAWFRMVVEAPGTAPEPSLYEATGTYVRDAGLWELVQAHVSGPVTTDSMPSPSDSAATPAAGE